MTIEYARTHAQPKPWGVRDLHPWNSTAPDGGVVGEIWYERADKSRTDSSLLLKLLFTSQPLSIQVHPDDGFARSIGLPRGKSEVWYVLSAAPDAKVALGLKKQISQQQLSAVLDDGSIADLVDWRPVFAGDVVYVPAGTIHAIGAGLVIAELQQRSDATFRLFDYARKRELHIENAKAVASSAPASFKVQPKNISEERTLLVSCPHFIFEKINLLPHSNWALTARGETWLLVLSGSANASKLNVVQGDAIFANSDVVNISTGPQGLVGLVGYLGDGPESHLLQHANFGNKADAAKSNTAQLSSSLNQAAIFPTQACAEMI